MKTMALAACLLSLCACSGSPDDPTDSVESATSVDGGTDGGYYERDTICVLDAAPPIAWAVTIPCVRGEGCTAAWSYFEPDGRPYSITYDSGTCR